MTGHSISRTSAKGGRFVGTCTLCGTTGLTTANLNDKCPNQRGLTQDEALVEAIDPTPAAAEARATKATEDDERLRRIAWSAAQRWVVYEEGDSLLDRDDVAYLKAFPPSVALALLDRISALSQPLPPPEAKDGAAPMTDAELRAPFEANRDGAAPSPEPFAWYRPQPHLPFQMQVSWGTPEDKTDWTPLYRAAVDGLNKATDAQLAPAAPSPDLAALEELAGRIDGMFHNSPIYVTALRTAILHLKAQPNAGPSADGVMGGK